MLGVESLAGISMLDMGAPQAHRGPSNKAARLIVSTFDHLGRFDLVYAWGVLRHTGDMFVAMDNAALAVGAGGRLFVAMYNDQGVPSRRWRRIKRAYNLLSRRLQTLIMLAVMGPLELKSAVNAIVHLQPQVYIRGWT